MKTLLKMAATVLLIWATAAPALAAPPANLNISSDRGQAFSLVLDGRLLTRPVARQVHVDLLAPGRHWADISLPTPYGPPMRFRTSVWLAPGLETSYVLAMSPYGPQLRQVAAVALGGPAGYPGGYPAQPGGGYYGSQPAPGQGGYYGTTPNAPYPGNYPNGGQYDNGGNYPDDGQYDNGNNGYPPATGPGSSNGNGSYPPTPAPGGNGNGGYPAPGGGYYPGSSTTTNLRPMSAGETQDLARALRQRSFDDDRLAIAKQALDQSAVRSEDLAALLKTFSFEKSRVELAKFGYAHVIDPQNFYRVYETFQFSSSTREVQQAIGVPQR